VIWEIVFLIFGAGFVGGLVNSLVAGELRLPQKDPTANVYRPGWIGSCLVGGVAAVTIWGLYGPLANTALLGGVGTTVAPILKVGELFGSLVTGMGGGRILFGEVDRRALQHQNAALVFTKNQLSDTFAQLPDPVGH
jgi:hypothetical protein